MMERRPANAPLAAEVVLIGAIALAVRLAHLDSATPTYDEFYHLLAARSWLRDGSLHIGAGEYTRAALYTGMVAESLRLFGDTLAAGRVPAAVAGTLWAVGLFVWTQRVAGGVAAWAAGLMFALDPTAVHLSQWVRFYTLQGLLVLIGVVCVHALVVGRHKLRRAVLIGAAGLVSFALATYFQRTALIALVGAGVWAAFALARQMGSALSSDRARARWLLIGAGVLLLVAGIGFGVSGIGAKLWADYTRVLPWTEPESTGSRWYAWWLGSRYPTLWALLPIAAVLAVARFPSLALLALSVFGTSFVAVSFAGSKAERYLAFAMPFFFLIWGLALATLLPALRAAAARAIAAVGGEGRLSSRTMAVASWGFTGLAVAFAVLANNAPRATWRMVFPGDKERPYREADWSPALPRLRPLVDSTDVVVASYVLKPVYYLGRGDVTLARTEVSELRWENGRPVEFSIDWRTGRPAISTPESLQRVMACFGSGLVLVERFHLNRAILVPEETTAFLLANTEEVPLPPDSWVLAFRWKRPVPPTQPGCPPWRSSTMSRPPS